MLTSNPFYRILYSYNLVAKQRKESYLQASSMHNIDGLKASFLKRFWIPKLYVFSDSCEKRLQKNVCQLVGSWEKTCCGGRHFVSNVFEVACIVEAGYRWPCLLRSCNFVTFLFFFIETWWEKRLEKYQKRRNEPRLYSFSAYVTLGNLHLVCLISVQKILLPIMKAETGNNFSRQSTTHV